MNADILYIACAHHRDGRKWAAGQGLNEGMFKTITLATSLKGLSKTTKVLYLDTGAHFPEAQQIQAELQRRFVNVSYYPPRT